MVLLTKVVFDTNVLISSILSNKGASHKLVALAAQGKIEGTTSPTLLAEFERSIVRDFGFSKHKTEKAVRIFLCFFAIVEPARRLEIIADDADNRVLERAVACKADYIASWDGHLTDLQEYGGIRITNPGRILDELEL